MFKDAACLRAQISIQFTFHTYGRVEIHVVRMVSLHSTAQAVGGRYIPNNLEEYASIFILQKTGNTELSSRSRNLNPGVQSEVGPRGHLHCEVYTASVKLT